MILLWSISRVIAEVSRYPGQSPGIEKPPGLMLWMVSAGEYTMIMFSLHIPRVKINKQTILHTMTIDSRKRPRQELYNQNIQLSIVYSFMDCFRNLSRVFTKVLAEVQTNVSSKTGNEWYTGKWVSPMPARNRPWLQLYKQNIQPSNHHSFMVCFRQLSRVDTKVPSGDDYV
jgi:hypothetical protein